MQLFVTCDCSQNTPVTSAKCGQTVQCVCGKKVTVPSFSELQKDSKAIQPSARTHATDSLVAHEEALRNTSKRRFLLHYSKLLVGLFCVLLSTLIAYSVLENQFDRKTSSRVLPPRLQAQEDSINAILLKHFKPLADGSTPQEIGWSLKYEGLDYMVGKSTSEFPKVFSSAYTLDEYGEVLESHRRVREWAKGKKSVVFLSTNIWKTIKMLENTHDADVLVVELDGEVITGYKFFANIGY